MNLSMGMAIMNVPLRHSKDPLRQIAPMVLPLKVAVPEPIAPISRILCKGCGMSTKRYQFRRKHAICDNNLCYYGRHRTTRLAGWSAWCRGGRWTCNLLPLPGFGPWGVCKVSEASEFMKCIIASSLKESSITCKPIKEACMTARSFGGGRGDHGDSARNKKSISSDPGKGCLRHRIGQVVYPQSLWESHLLTSRYY